MPLTPDQTSLTKAYYEARKPYHKLLLEALQDAPPNQTREYPIKSKNTSSETPELKRPDYEGLHDDKPQPGESFRDLVTALQSHQISEPEEERRAAVGKK